MQLGLYTRSDFTPLQDPLWQVMLTYAGGPAWANIAAPSVVDDAQTAARTAWLRGDPRRRIVISVMLAPTGIGHTGAAALWRLDPSAFTACAAALAKAWPGQVIARLGWEMNGDGWYPWQKGPEPQTVWADAYVNAFRIAAKPFRGAGIPVDWCLTPEAAWAGCYPGDDAVDYIGLDAYGVRYAQTVAPTGAEIAEAMATRRVQLGDVCALARQHGKPVSLPEFAPVAPGPANGAKMSRGCGDDPAYIDGIASILAAHRQAGGLVGYGCYWGVDDSALSNYPNTAAALPKLATA